MAENVEIKGAKLIFKNFRGAADKFNAKGNRNFCVILSPEQADQLAHIGWNVKQLKPREEGDLPTYYIKVNVQFDTVGKPPNVRMITKRNQTRLDEDLVDLLDDAYIEKANIRFRPYEYDPGKFSAYLVTLYAEVVEDDLGAEYADIPLAGSGGHVDRDDFDG